MPHDIIITILYLPRIYQRRYLPLRTIFNKNDKNSVHYNNYVCLIRK